MVCISKSTLHNHISQNVTHGDKPGPDQLLSPAEEEELSNFIIEIAQAGYRKTRKEIRNIIGRVAVDIKRRKIPDVSHGWFQRFMQTYLYLSYQKDDFTANVRMNCLSKEVISDYFHLLMGVLTENKLLNSHSRIYNVDKIAIYSSKCT